jgi:dephospho-CoA kinase
VLSVGLTGGIGSGKSAVSALLTARGAAVVDADVIAREVVAPGTPGLARIVAEFGDEVLAPDGTLDRPALGARVFADEAARLRLNAIVHPLVGEQTLARMAQAERDGVRVLVHDVPLLVESGLGAGYHLVVVVDAPVDLRLARLEERGLPREQATSRMAAQAGDAQRQAAADAWIDNAGSRGDLDRQVRALWDERLVPFSDNLSEGRPAPRGPVHLVEPQERWAADGVRLVARLRHLTGGAEVEHVGSTAVPGLRARDVVDLQVTVADRAAVQALEPALSAGGFPRRRDVTGDHVRAHPDPVAWRRHVHLSADPGRAADVHVRVAGSTSARASLALRDRLRADARAREEYAALKTQLAERHADDVDAYAEGKSELVVRLTAQAPGG